MGLLASLFIVKPPWFWLCTLTAQSAGIAALCYTIVEVGNAFYPTKHHRHRYWILAVSVIIIYAAVGATNVGIYIFEKLIPRPLSNDDMLNLLNELAGKNAKAFEISDCFGLKRDISWMFRLNFFSQGGSWMDIAFGNGKRPGNGTMVSSYGPGPALLFVYSFPHLKWYLAFQVLMIFVCGWASMYLFIPLVRSHRSSTSGKTVGSDAMAIGVWYLTLIFVIATIYAGLIVAYCVENSLLYDMRSQALELCLRATAGAIFFLPSPGFLLRFYRRRNRSDIPEPSTKPRYKLYREETPTRRGSFSDAEDDDDKYIGQHFSQSSRYNTPSRFSPDGSRVEFAARGATGFDRAQSSASNPSHAVIELPARSYNPRHSSLNYDSKHSSQGSNFNRLRMFSARERGASMESSKVLNREFGLDNDNDDDHDLFDEPQAPNAAKVVVEKTMNVDPTTIDDPTLHPADIMRDYATEYFYHPYPTRLEHKASVEAKMKDPTLQKSDGTSNDTAPSLAAAAAAATISSPPVVVDEPQKPETAYLPTNQPARNALPNTVESPAPSSEKPADDKIREASIDITGTTGWEIGGWLHNVPGRSASPTGQSHPLEPVVSAPVSPASSPPLSPLSAPSIKSIRDSPRLSRQFSSPSPTLGRLSFDIYGNRKKSPSDDEDDFGLQHSTTPPLHQLTGLQKQLAESRSALFPIVMAMAEQDRDEDYDLGHFPTTNLLKQDSPAYDNLGVGDDLQNESYSRPSGETLLSKLGSGMGRSGLQAASSQYGIDSSNRLQSAVPYSAKKVPVLTSPLKLADKNSQSSSSNQGTKKNWLTGRKNQDSGLSRKSDPQLASVPETSGNSNGNNGNSHNGANTNNNAKAEAQSSKAKETKPREGRLAALSKALTGGGSSRNAANLASSNQRHGRPSQDVNSGDLDREKGDGLGQSNAMTTVPTVQDLAMASTEEDNDTGLQYYFPDPYSHLAEFNKRPAPLNLSQINHAPVMERTSSSQVRHPLSPTYADSSKSDAAFGSKTTANASIGFNGGNNVGSDTSSVRQGEDGSLDGNSTKSSSKSSKLGLPKKSLLREIKQSSTNSSNNNNNSSNSSSNNNISHNNNNNSSTNNNVNNNGTNNNNNNNSSKIKNNTVNNNNINNNNNNSSNHGNSSSSSNNNNKNNNNNNLEFEYPPGSPPANQQHHQQHNGPLGALLSRSASGSKKIGNKIKARGVRSKSDVAPARASSEHGRVISAPMSELPITVTRKPPVPQPLIPPGAQMSLSPPPRQTWTRSKSFQGTTAAITAALLGTGGGGDHNSVDQDGVEGLEESDMSINTRIANEHGRYTEPLKSSSTTSSRSPPMSPTANATFRTSSESSNHHNLSNTGARLFGSPSIRAVHNSNNNNNRQHARNHSVESGISMTESSGGGGGRVSLPSSPTSPSFVKERLGFSTAAMDFRRAANRHQRSADNLASSYYYKRAAEMNQAPPPPPPLTPLPVPPNKPIVSGSPSTLLFSQQQLEQQPQQIMPTTTLLSSTSGTGYSYFNAPVSLDTSANSSVRNSPSNPYGPSSSSSSAILIQGGGGGGGGAAGSSPMTPTHYFHHVKTGSSLSSSAMVGTPPPTTSVVVSGSGGGMNGYMGGQSMTPSLSNGSRNGSMSTIEQQRQTPSSSSGGGGGGGDGTDSRTNSIGSVQLKDDPWTQAMVARALMHSPQRHRTEVVSGSSNLSNNSGGASMISAGQGSGIMIGGNADF
ncbi:hypothetical protein BG004_001126, partial [Podila humilis]